MKVSTRHPDERPRCAWVTDDALYRAYHDEEWGRPEHDGQRLYEMLSLESFQAGLSWLTILRKRHAFRSAFANFHPSTVAAFDENDVARLLNDPGIVRHRGKIEATISGARAWLEIEASHPGGFSAFIWQHRPPHPHRSEDGSGLPEATQLSRRLKQSGFRFVGPTITHSFMQAAGLVQDHDRHCFLRKD
ncbi:DNA-3-methyladenine glycosylase I [Aquibaculum arenosum]|uniref:DNA-3-methyladenine glycosylase I n=1 Tax=Aquibaculum arenosum TaxID=3032591 RepID=A0ABT5YPK4_9PROT|nr:DNA-3-methyladenine glycosylase I [Fodinicurvata sp. CAU 1616]MDF2096716.1 DNA-3-methyladenine glycosylase I [Fodinicurvata sp. CAU 1616]